MAADAGASGKELEAFLGKVDEIEALVKGLNSGDDDILREAIAKADEYITSESVKESADTLEVEGIETKTGFSRTMINSTPSAPDDLMAGPNLSNMNHAGFMAAMEADARERSERRKDREKVAAELKKKGNEAFKLGNFEQALKIYTEAINNVRDNTVLYTNRAQTHIKLGKYQEALVDCDWALRVSDSCIKAYIHAGRAHLGLQEHEKARDFYRKALEKDPKKETIINEYLVEVDRAEQTLQDEKAAQELFESGNKSVTGLVETLKKVSQPGQLPLYYSGGFRIVSSLISTIEDRTLFRTSGGLSLAKEHPMLSRCLLASPQSLSKEERDLIIAAIDMWTHACTDSEANQESLFEVPDLADHLLQLVELKVKGQGRLLKSSVLSLLFTMSLTDVGRRVIANKFNLSRFLSCLFNMMHKSGAIAVKAVSCLNNMVLEKTFRSKLRSIIDTDVLPIFHKLVHSASSSPEVVSNCVTILISLAGDDAAIRNKMRMCNELWEDCIHLMHQHRAGCTMVMSHRDAMREVLGLLMSLSVEASPNLQEHGRTLCQQCLAMCQTSSMCVTITERCLSVLSHVLPRSVPSVEWACQNEGPQLFLTYVKGKCDHKMRSSLKCLTACTQIDTPAREYVVQNKGLGHLRDLLQHKEETVVGNAALCLSHCVLVPKAAKALTKTDIVKDLLVLARDGKKSDVQQNCAILLAKLAQGDAKHLQKLRELHGIEILHDCMKYIK